VAKKHIHETIHTLHLNCLLFD